VKICNNSWLYFVMILLAALTIMSMTYCNASTKDIHTRIKCPVKEYDYNLDSIVQSYIPGELLVSPATGQDLGIKLIQVHALPITDSLGLAIDTSKKEPEYLFLLYGVGYSVFRVLQNTESGHEPIYTSGLITGIGSISLDDLNADQMPEIIVDLWHGNRGYSNIFIFFWSDGQIRPADFIKEVKGYSPLNIYVHFKKSDSGTIIQVNDADGTTKGRYIFEKGINQAREIKK